MIGGEVMQTLSDRFRPRCQRCGRRGHAHRRHAGGRRQPDHDERAADVSDAFGAEAGVYTTTVTDDVDPVIVGGAVSYKFVTPFKQTLPSGITGTYKGGQLFMHIPAGLYVTVVSTQQPPGGSSLTASAAKQGNDIVVTTTGSIPIDGAVQHATPNLIVQATTGATAGGTRQVVDPDPSLLTST